MRTGCWWRLLARNGFRIAPGRSHIALGVTCFTPVNDLLAIAQRLIYGRRIRTTEITHSPVFILGHWRSGTTLLHELLEADPQFASPNTFQCFAPWHFLLSEYLMVRFGNFLIPKKRPMDEMKAGWSLPQEDEFALMNLGLPTPYLRIAFPRTQDRNWSYLDLQDLSPAELRAWEDRFLWFLKTLTVRYGTKRLILKSPPHTGRLAELARIFPDAKFIHLTRDPRKLFSSTMRLWRSLDEVQALQKPLEEPQLKEFVIRGLQRMYEGFEAARPQLPDNRLVDVRYEALVEQPKQTMRQLYDRLDLGDFQQAEPRLDERLQGHNKYQPNRHPLDAGLEREILSFWSQYAETYGYN